MQTAYEFLFTFSRKHGSICSILLVFWYMDTHTHTRLTALCPGLPRWAGARKVKPIWILLKQETVSGSGISWAICKSAPRFRHITVLAPHHSSFLQAGCPSCHPTNSVKALKALLMYGHRRFFGFRDILATSASHADQLVWFLALLRFNNCFPV